MIKKKQTRRIFGICILSLVFIGLFAFTAQDGFIEALIDWGCSIVITAIIVLGVVLAVGN